MTPAAARLADLATLIGRVPIAMLFPGGAAQKALEPSAAEALLAARGWPVWPALVCNLGAGLALLTGIALRPAAVALAAYCAATNLFHLIPADPWQMTIFVKNWAIAGGCLVLAAHGAGRFSLHRQGTAVAPGALSPEMGEQDGQPRIRCVGKAHRQQGRGVVGGGRPTGRPA